MQLTYAEAEKVYVVAVGHGWHAWNEALETGNPYHAIRFPKEADAARIAGYRKGTVETLADAIMRFQP